MDDEPDEGADEPDEEAEDGDWDAGEEDHRILSWRQLGGGAARRRWFVQLWDDVCLLRHRYGLAVRSRWWEDELRVEALAALAAWIARYDTGEWDDPPGKLTLLFELERLDGLLRDGNDPFHPERDRGEFERHLDLLGA